MQRYTDIDEAFLRFDLKSFLTQYGNQDPAKLALRYKSSHSFETGLLFDQITLHQKAQKKLPSWAHQYCFFTRKALEQASSEVLAKYKASLFNGNLLLDLSGGLGVDDWAFAASFKQVVSTDPDAGLNQLVRKNMELLGVANTTRLDETAESLLAQYTQKVDLVYVDADRRSDQRKAVHLFEGSPDLVKILGLVTRITTQVLLKLSPLIDITHLEKNLQHIREIQVVSLRNEVKEVLVWIDFNHIQPPTIKAVDIDAGNQIQSFTSGNHPSAVYNHIGTYFFEPALCLIKSGLAPAYGAQMGLSQVAASSMFMVANHLPPQLMGRSFKVVAGMPFAKKAVKAYLNQCHISKANISKRHFPMDVESLYQTLSLKEGGEDYLFFTTTQSGQKWMYHCVKPD